MSVVEFAAPSRVYQQPRSSAVGRMEIGGYELPAPTGLAKTKTGGMATVFPGHPFPRKTFVYSGITAPNNKAKRITLALFLPFASLRKGIKAFLNNYLLNFNRLVDSIYADCDQVPYLHYQYYSEFGKSLWDFIYLFLKKIGIKDEIAYRTGLQITTIIEYDDAYKVRIQDVLNESSKEALLKNPRKELLRLVGILAKRDPTFSNTEIDGAGTRIIKTIQMASLLLYWPPIKKAFVFALENINFEWLKFDEWDYYWCLNRGDYNPLGKPFDERKSLGVQMMVDYAKKMNPDKEVVVEEVDGQTLINTYDK